MDSLKIVDLDSSDISVSPKFNYRTDLPHIIKYMGGKRKLLGFIADAINEIYSGEPICDLFAGSAIVGGSFAENAPIYSNDIQEYSSILAKTYLSNINWDLHPNILTKVIEVAEKHVKRVKSRFSELQFDYSTDLSLEEFNALEFDQQQLIYHDFRGVRHHLFIKNYSGTYWSFEQCLWIDALRVSIESYSDSPLYSPLMAALMHAMAYNAQSTGHYAQYRDANNKASMEDILLYRRREVLPYFEKKLNEIIVKLSPTCHNHTVTSLDFRKCLKSIPKKTLVYADPPYAFVHYSRFYHALETLVKYDYPKVLYKGRYRDDRHQSPFCRKTEVNSAFESLFQGIKERSCKLALSYSNTGMISLKKLLEIANIVFDNEYIVSVKALDYSHSTMGRSDEKSREVKEYLILATPKQQ